MQYFVSFGIQYGRGGLRLTGQDYVHAPTIQQARIIARSMCARHEQVLTVEQLPVVEDNDLLDYESIEVI
jgi:hypothetical protein